MSPPPDWRPAHYAQLIEEGQIDLRRGSPRFGRRKNWCSAISHVVGDGSRHWRRTEDVRPGCIRCFNYWTDVAVGRCLNR
jgi:hypothetical protein